MLPIYYHSINIYTYVLLIMVHGFFVIIWLSLLLTRNKYYTDSNIYGS